MTESRAGYGPKFRWIAGAAHNYNFCPAAGAKANFAFISEAFLYILGWQDPAPTFTPKWIGHGLIKVDEPLYQRARSQGMERN